MTNKLTFLYLLITNYLFSLSLYDMYINAEPLYEYDKYIILDPNQIYTGGIGIFDENIYIEGNGSIINLQNNLGIWAFSDENTPANIDISRCTIINGSEYALSFHGYSTGTVLNCNLVNSNFGIKVFDYANVSMKNTNLINNVTYGAGIYSTTPTLNVSYCNAWGNNQDYMENCPG